MFTMPFSFVHYFCYRYALNTRWVENKIAGIPRLLVGKRNKDGVVHTLEMLQTDDIPGLAEVKL